MRIFTPSLQMARPLSFFLTCDSDPAGVKQLLRRLLAWSSRSNPPDAQWDSLWGDLFTLQTDAFPFLDTQYLLSEFVRALLRAGRLPLAKAYVSGSRKRPPLLVEKAETLVLGAAREYFYSAASLDRWVVCRVWLDLCKPILMTRKVASEYCACFE
jgi:hypothetical protein